MLSPSPSEISLPSTDDCAICLMTLAPGTALLTLSCNHKFHLQCLVSNAQAQNKECPLCRTTIDASVLQILVGSTQTPTPTPTQQTQVALVQVNQTAANVLPSVEDPIDETVVRHLFEQFTIARQAAIASLDDTDSLPLINTVTTLEYLAQSAHEESNIYGLITLQAPSILQRETNSIAAARVPIDLVCVVDQSGSMSGEKMVLLKKTLIYIVEQLNELDRLAIVSFNSTAFDRSHGLKRMNQQNQQILTNAMNNDIASQGGTYIGSGLQIGIDLLKIRQTKNPLSALLLLTDGQDNQEHDYRQLMENLPEGAQCHTFGYGPDHTASLLAELAQLGHGGTFTYIDQEQAVGSAFVMVLAGLFTCVAEEICVNIEFNENYNVTHFHSKYTYEPEQLPSTKISVKLHNLNADEKRNLVFQLHIPKVDDEQNVEMASQSSASQDESSDVNLLSENHCVGHVTITYVDPNISRSITTNPVSFQLVRVSSPPTNLLQINPVLDRQRNRIETTQALEQAMAESDFQASRTILMTQVEKIKHSVSVQDPFCQELIQDLERIYPSEREYRSSHCHTYMSHRTERGTYVPNEHVSSQRYNTDHQRQLAASIQRKYFS
ncbi:unnamed protein product [Rotaria socialis]|uniref:VWFA domain-containing protein n=1 Tax=Rotaria socialis TaxID=392032 RepID=A0A817U7K3_9BILA|nr:unnamed protein product [Rotaria socialis]CAF4382176.1 unnamed protein product [Rotaria socialis]